jgi:hypothetical protein
MVEIRRRRFRAMELITILNRCHRFRGFVYQHAHFSARGSNGPNCNWLQQEIRLGHKRVDRTPKSLRSAPAPGWA